MNQRKTILFTLFGLALVSGLLIAATDSTPAPAAPAATPAPAPDNLKDAIRGRIMEKLGLSDEQKKKIAALSAERDAALAALKADTTLAPEARHQKARTILSDYHGKMLAELTPEQQKKAAEMRSEAAEHMRQKGWVREDKQARRAEMGPGQSQGPRNPLAIVAMGERIKDRIAEKLQLTDEQRDKLEHLGRAYRAQQREATKKHLEEMRAVLTPEQQQKVDAWKQHHRGAGGRPHGPRIGADNEDGPAGMMVASDDNGTSGEPDEE